MQPKKAHILPHPIDGRGHSPFSQWPGKPPAIAQTAAPGHRFAGLPHHLRRLFAHPPPRVHSIAFTPAAIFFAHPFLFPFLTLFTHYCSIPLGQSPKILVSSTSNAPPPIQFHHLPPYSTIIAGRAGDARGGSCQLPSIGGNQRAAIVR
jgi:hypothetical protein